MDHLISELFAKYVDIFSSRKRKRIARNAVYANGGNYKKIKNETKH